VAIYLIPTFFVEDIPRPLGLAWVSHASIVMHPNGSFHLGVEHAALPVKSGEKVGLNVWLWDPEWTPPPGEAERLVQWRK